MTIREQIERKLAIRAFARENMGETINEINDDSFFQAKTVNSKTNNIDIELERLQNHIRYVQKNVVQTEYWELKSERKYIGPVIVFIKKSVRKVFLKVLGWYLNKVLYQQTQYNQGSYSALKNIDNILIQQDMEMKEQMREIERMAEYINKQCNIILEMKEEFETLKANLELQREEYTMMIRYYDK